MVTSIIIVLLLVIGCPSTSYSEDQPKVYYWIKDGIYFKYDFNVYSYSLIGRKGGFPVFTRTYYDYIIFIETHNGSNRHYYVEIDNIKIIWKIVDVSNDSHIKVEYEINMSNAVILEELNPLNIMEGRIDRNKTIDITLKKVYLVNLETLDTYTVDGREWVGEWIFLLQPRLTINMGIKYLSISPGNLTINIPYNYETMGEIISYMKLINDTVFNYSDGAKTYYPLDDREFYEEIGSITFIISNSIANFFFVHPPPYEVDYDNGGLYFDKSRLCGYFSSLYAYATTLFQEYNDSFQELYNSSDRKMMFIKFPSFIDESDYYIFMIDPNGDVHWMWIYPANVTYDSVTGVLLLFEGGPELPYVLFPFKDLSRNYTASVFGSFITASIRLVETNLDFSRPIFGKRLQNNNSEANSVTRESEEEPEMGTDEKLFDIKRHIYFIGVVVVIIPVIIIILYRLLRIESGR